MQSAWIAAARGTLYKYKSIWIEFQTPNGQKGDERRMPDYKKLYFALCRANAQAADLLLHAARQAEEELLREDPPPLRLRSDDAPSEPNAARPGEPDRIKKE
jgi:hypothetical protein